MSPVSPVAPVDDSPPSIPPEVEVVGAAPAECLSGSSDCEGMQPKIIEMLIALAAARRDRAGTPLLREGTRHVGISGVLIRFSSMLGTNNLGPVVEHEVQPR